MAIHLETVAKKDDQIIILACGLCEHEPQGRTCEREERNNRFRWMTRTGERRHFPVRGPIEKCHRLLEEASDPEGKGRLRFVD